ncbi:MAG: NeuD/PglB/VioB family sugar acetyltransferase [Planctomycetes bacterium]|nr:NeuD/PglB/VioB family sugar acetyltransferase [Planctomycetota bacterium]
MPEPRTFVLWGASGHARVLADAIGLHGGRVTVLFDNDTSVLQCLPGVPVLHGEQALRAWAARQTSLRTMAAGVAIGGARGADRIAIAALMRSVGLALPVIAHPTASISSTARIADGCHVLANAVVAADADLGEMTIVNNGAVVDHECRLGRGVHVAPGSTLCGCVQVEDEVLIGAGAVVLPRLRIGRGAVVGAGSVVTRDVPDRVVVQGVPATQRSLTR